MSNLLHKGITDSILKTYYDVYNQLGYGFFGESLPKCNVL